VQLLHPALPRTDLYFPAAQLTQLPPSGPVKPMLHRQSVAASLAAALQEFSGQPLHAASPEADSNVPSGQGEHSPPFAPV